MPTFRFGSVHIEYEDRFPDFTFQFEGKDYFIPDIAFFWCDPSWIKQFEDTGIPMADVSHFNDFMTKVINADPHLRQWLKDVVSGIAIDYEEEEAKHLLSVYNADPDVRLFELRHVDPYDYDDGHYEGRRVERSEVLLPLPTAEVPPPENGIEYVRIVDRAYNHRNHTFKTCVVPHVGERDLSQFQAYYYRRMNYSFRPDYTFLEGPKEVNACRFFGLELEMSTDLSPLELQRIALEVEPKQEPFFFFKDDSSVTGNREFRYELVTHPMTPRRMKSEFRILFKKLHKLCKEKGVAFDYIFDLRPDNGNGLHIHVGNDAFVYGGTRYNNRSFHKNRFLTAFNQWDTSFQMWLQKLTRRPSMGIRSDYYPPHPGMDGRTLARRLMRGQEYDEHRSACHDGGQTTEVRVFYGLPDLNHILSCIEIVDSMIDFTNDAAPRNCFGRHFIDKYTAYVMRQPGHRYAKEALRQCV